MELQDRRVSMEAQTEAKQLLEEQRQLHEDLQAELMEAVARGDALEEHCCSLENQLTKMMEDAELECLRAVESLRQKYDEQEDSLLQQIRDLQQQFLQLQSHIDAGGNATCDGDPSKETTIPQDGEQSAPGTAGATNKGEGRRGESVCGMHTYNYCKDKWGIKGLIYH